MITEKEREAQREYHRLYMRKWRAEHPAENAKRNELYWARYAARKLEELRHAETDKNE